MDSHHYGGIIAAIVNGFFAFTIAGYWVGPIRKKVQERCFTAISF